MKFNRLVELNDYEGKLVDVAIRRKSDIIRLWMHSIMILSNNYRTEPSSGSCQLVINKGRMSRIVVRSKRRIFSANFPFEVKLVGELSGITEFIFRGTSGANFSTYYARRILNYLDSDANIFDRQFLPSLDGFYEQCADEPELFEQLVFLINQECGYLRAEDDPINENGRIHPRFHVDIFYSNSTKFKLGLSNMLTLDSLTDTLDIDTECAYLN